MKKIFIAVAFLLAGVVGSSVIFAVEPSKQIQTIEILSPAEGDEVSILHENQIDFWEHDFQTRNVSAHVSATDSDQSKPVKTVLKWRNAGFLGDVNVYLNTEPNFYGIQPIAQTSFDEVSVDNLLKGQTYYWKVVSSDGSVSSEISSFVTADEGPRTMNVGGISNVRDIGGYLTEDGKRVRQGVVYRGTEMNNIYNITPTGKSYMRDVLKIRTDLDFRSESESQGITHSPLGEDVNYVRAPILGYYHQEKYEVREYFVTVMKVFAEPNNYPVYFHCYAGADRTGMVAFLFGALLGVPYETLVRDYEFTSFSPLGIRQMNSADSEVVGKEMNNFYDALMRYDGDSLKERAETYVISYLGLTPSEVMIIRDCMLE